ncbi:outer membrane beta-barrel protein [bacterium]|nr:outer membrane beta-barrel protein [bacterium]
MTKRFLPTAAAWFLALAVLGAGPAAAQSDRPPSETGRHKPVPKKVEPQPERSLPGRATPSRWSAGLAFGMVSGGDLWHVETVTEVAVPWQSLVRFTSERFNAALDQNFGLGVYVTRRMNDRWSLRGEIGTSRVDVAAEALQGQQGAVFLYDRFSMTSIALAAEIRLVRLPSHPYLTAGPVLLLVDSTQWDDLDQTRLGGRLGLGYLYAASPEFSLRAEARYSRASFDSGDFRPQAEEGYAPEITFEPDANLNLFELVLAVEMNF